VSSPQPVAPAAAAPHPHREALAGRKAETRRRILAAAREIFLRDGFAETNLNDVARNAEVGKGTLYRHFENKADLYVAMLTEKPERFFDTVREQVDHGASVPEQLRQIADCYVDFWLAHPETLRVIWAVQNQDLIGGLSPALLERLGALFERPLRDLEALIRSGVERGELRPCDPWNTANVLTLTGNAIVVPMVNGDHAMVDRDLRAIFRQAVDLLLAGLAPPSASRGDGAG
jgi:AcrR family transcriptional regulator